MSEPVQPEIMSAEEWSALVAPGVGADGVRLYIDRGTYEGRNRHALAALALHGQPFGFSAQDVADVQTFADVHCEDGDDLGVIARRLPSLAARLQDLLPPTP